jgi:hypothetical protein
MTTGSPAPLQKISFAALSGLILALVFWALRSYAGIVIDPEGVALITALTAAIVGYMTPLAPAEVVAIKDAAVE